MSDRVNGNGDGNGGSYWIYGNKYFDGTGWAGVGDEPRPGVNLDRTIDNYIGH